MFVIHSLKRFLALTIHQAESFKSECYGGTGLYYRGDSVGVKNCVKDCDPQSKLSFLSDGIILPFHT